MTRLLLVLVVCLTVVSACAAQSSPPEEWVRMFDYDRSLPLNVQDSIVETTGQVTIHDVLFDSPKGGRVTAYLVVPGGKGPFVGVVFGHWGNGTYTEFLPEAIAYARAGAVCILPGYPWVRPAPWRQNILDFSAPEKDRDICIQAVVDLRRAADLLLTRSDVDSSRLAYVGHSYGAQWGAILSAVDKRFKAAVLAGGVPTLGDIFSSEDPDFVALRNAVPKESFDKYIEVNRVLDGIRFVPFAAPTPLLFQFARYERYFGEKSMTRYAAAASNPKLVSWYDTGHELNDPLALLDRADFLGRCVGLPSVRPFVCPADR